MPDRVNFTITARNAPESEPVAICAICEERVPLDLILGHLAGAHDLDVEIEEWPDGSPVIVDSTLEPRDFAPGPQVSEEGERG